jgi:hypothetical protein
MKVDQAIDDVLLAEEVLAARLMSLAEEHASEHDVLFMSRTLAQASIGRSESLRAAAASYGFTVEPHPSSTEVVGAAVGAARRGAPSTLTGSGGVDASLLVDLRQTYLAAQEAGIDWVILLQSAKASRDGALIDLSTRGHEEVERCGAWLRTHVKTAAPQLLVAG